MSYDGPLYPDLLVGMYSEGNYSLDNYIAFPGTGHMLACARTGQGKTESIAIPNAFAWPGSLVCLDIKETIRRRTSGFRKYVLGHEVKTFNPTAWNGCSDRWNILDMVDRTSPRRFTQIGQIAKLLIPDPPSANDSTSIFWQPAAQQALSAILFLLAEMPDEAFTIENAYTIFLRGDGLPWLLEAIKKRRRYGPPLSKRTIWLVSDYVGRGDRLTEDIRKSVTTNLGVFIDPYVAAATRTSTFDVRQLRRQPMALYVTISPADIDRLKPLLRLLFSAIISFNSDLIRTQDPTLCVPMLMILDEFAQIGAQPIMAHSARYMREFGVRIIYIIQDPPQLIGLYGQADASDIINNVDQQTVFGLNDVKVAQEIEDRIGHHTAYVDTYSRPKYNEIINYSRHNKSETIHKVPEIYAYQLTNMEPHKQLLIRPAGESIITYRIRAYDDPNFKKLEMEPPDTPTLDVEIELDDGSIKLPFISPPSAKANPPPPDWIAAATVPKPPPPKGGGDPHHGHPPPARPAPVPFAPIPAPIPAPLPAPLPPPDPHIP
jgi:type IV secretion system protein VirD4